MEQLLTRDEFRNGVFKRDNYRCVICGEPGKDAHHIIERRLFEDGGYYLSNGATLCEKHHLLAESTELSCNEIRIKAGIDNVLIPEHFYDDLEYDKWGNILLPNGTRVKGDLFYDESVQKIIRPVIGDFIKYVKYFRTYHLPWSNMGKDDRMMHDTSTLENEDEVIATLKLDGENTNWYNDFIHARSLDSGNHESRNWVKGLWAQKAYLLDENMRICGENLYAKHSLGYDNLKSYFYMFSMWIDNVCLSWDETVEYAGVLGLETVPVIYRGKFDRKLIEQAFEPYRLTNEGYVVRTAGEFTYGTARKYIAKYVRPEFRRMINDSHGHWMSKKVEKNKLAL